VAALIARKDADMGEPFAKERRSIEQRLLDEERNRLFSTYLAMTQKQMKEDGKIKVYEDAIATAVNSGAQAPGGGQAPGGPPQPTRPRQRRTPQGVR